MRKLRTLLLFKLLLTTTMLQASTPSKAVAFEDLMPGPTDRAAFVGQTGSGKTTLAEHILRLRPYVVALDPKGTLWGNRGGMLKGYELHSRLETLCESRAPKLIYRPIYEELQDSETMDLFFQWAFRRGNTALYVDEVYAIAKGDSFPPHYGACLTRGREVGVVVYSATQRPARVPQIMFSESEHVYCFNLKMPKDRERVSDMTGLDPDRLSLPKFQFYYAPQDGDLAGPLKLRLGGVS